MAEIFDFGQLDPEQDIYGMGRDELRDLLGQVRERIDELDGREPSDMYGEDYESWADEHERLEDLADEIQDLLDM